MAYTPTSWENSPSTATPLSAANLNKLTDELEAQALAESLSHSLPTWANGTSPALTDAAPLNEMERVAQAVAVARGLSYTPTVWGSGWSPARNAARLNQLEQQVAANSTAQSADISYFMSPDEITTMRINALGGDAVVADAWANVRAEANTALTATAQTRTSTENLGDWHLTIYPDINEDGAYAMQCARAYRITGTASYGDRAKYFIMAWRDSYPTSNPTAAHYIAEAPGLIKFMLAFDLVQDRFSAAEKTSFRTWMSYWYTLWKTRTDAAIDAEDRGTPWNYGTAPDGTNGAKYANTVAWARAAAVCAAAAIGGSTLSEALAWNWAHTTARGLDYGWTWWMTNAIWSTNAMVDELTRQNLDYGMFTLEPLGIIADIARHVGYSVNLWTSPGTNGRNLKTTHQYYAPYVRGSAADPYNANWSSYRGGYQTYFELPARVYSSDSLIASVPGYDGAATRADRRDYYVYSHNAITKATTASAASRINGWESLAVGNSPDPVPITSGVDDYFNDCHRFANDRIQIVSSPVKTGSRAAQYVVYSGDNVLGTGNNRAEHLGPSGAPFCVGENAEVWVGFDVFFPGAGTGGVQWYDRASDWNFFAQCHSTSNAGQALLQMIARDTGVIVKTNGGVDGSTNNWITVYSDASAITKDVWHRWEVGWRWSSTGTGWIEIWWNSVNVLPRRLNTYTLYAGYSAYWKQGIYRGEDSTPSRVFHDNFKIGTTRASVV